MFASGVKNIKVKYFSSVVIDMLSIYIAWLLTAIIFAPIDFALKDFVNEFTVVKIKLVFDLTIWCWYFLFHFKKSGQTLGLRLFGLQLYCQDKNNLSLVIALCYGIMVATPISALILTIFIGTSSLHLVGQKNVSV